MNLFYSITLYLWDYIFSISDKNEIKILRIICKDFRNISINYWIQNIPDKEVNNYFINNQKLKFYFRFIILKSKKIDFKNTNNKYLLFKSCDYGYLEIVKFLIKNGVNINQKDSYENNALFYACTFGHLEIVKLLIENGVNIKQRNNSDNTALYYAYKYGYSKIVKLIIENDK